MDFVGKLLNFFYPPRCQLCETRHNLSSTGQLCAPCAGDLRVNHTACQICAIPLGASSAELANSSPICARCIQTAPDYDFCWSPFIYAQPLEWMIQQLKFSAKLNFAPLLADLMVKNMPHHLCGQMKPDVIIPMPLHSRRIKQRGFNQSYLLAKPLARFLNLPIDLNSCERIRDTEHQTGKNARQRRQNIKGAFKFNNKNNYKYVIVFDDVVTTGSSISELSKTLKRAGVKRVDVWCLARAEKINYG